MRDEFDDVAETAPAQDIPGDHGHPMRAKPDGAVDPAGEAGWYLERERERRGETLEQAGDATGIHPHHIAAIEHGDMTRMPQRLEALEMIGIYAQYLSFDPDPLVRHYAQFLPRPSVAPRSAHPANPAPLSSAKILKFGKMPKLPKFSFNVTGIPGGTGGLVASVAGAIFLFAGISWLMVPDATPTAGDAVVAEDADSVDTMPTASTGAEPAEVKVTDQPLPDDSNAVQASEAAADDTAGTNLGGIEALIAEDAAGAVPAPPAAPATAKKQKVASAEDMTLTDQGREFGAKSGGTRLMLKARAPVWVRIEDTQGNVVMTQMLMRGDTYRVPDRDGLVVIARDGGLLSYIIDGKEKGILGPPGEILVGRSLDLKDLDKRG